MTVTMKKKPSAIGGVNYQISYRVKGTSSWKTKTTIGNTLKITNLKKGKAYQVRVRTTAKAKGKTYYSSYSPIKTSGKIKYSK